MASYNPPLENLPIFDSSVFNNVEEPLTTSSAGTQFLKYPIAQGTETLSDIIVLGTSNFSGTETHNGQIIANNNITINNASVINQTDQTTNVSNNFKSSYVYGDFSIISNGTYGGAIRFGQIGQLNYGDNFTQQYQSGSQFSVISQSLGGSILLTQRNALNNAFRNLLQLTTTGSTMQRSASDGNYAVLSLKEQDSGGTIMVYPNVSVGSYMPIIAGDNLIVSRNSNTNTPNTTALVVGCHSNVSNGLKIDSVGNTTLIGQGGTTNGVYTTSFSCDGTSSTIKGPAVFSSTTAPTSAQTILASNDNSNNIPTTAWVQTAIVNVAASPLYFRAYKFMTNPALPFTTNPIGNLNINFTNGSTLKINDSITIRFSIRYDYNDTSSTAQSTYYNSYYGNLIIYPNRVITNTSSVPVYLNGSLNGQTSYTYNNATFAPNGRYIWTENYSNTQIIDSLNNNPNPIIITSILQSQLTLQFNIPYNTTSVPLSNCSLSVYLELINNNNSTLTTITTSGSSFFDSVQKNF